MQGWFNGFASLSGKSIQTTAGDGFTQQPPGYLVGVRVGHLLGQYQEVILKQGADGESINWLTVGMSEGDADRAKAGGYSFFFADPPWVC